MNKEDKEFFKKYLPILLITIGLVLFVTFTILSLVLNIEVLTKIVLIIIGLVILLVCYIIGVYLDWKVSVYICPLCKEKIKPKFLEVFFAKRSFTKTCLRCPECEEICDCEKEYEKNSD